MFTKKHYIHIAKMFKTVKDKMSKEDIDSLVCEFADLFENDNERFDRDKFFDAIYK